MKKTQSQLKLLLAALLCAFVVSSKGQTVWNKTYIADRPAMLFGSVLATDTGYIATGLTYGVIPNLQKSMIGNIDLNGTMTQYKIIVDSTPATYSTYSNALIKTTNGRIAFTGKSYDSLPCIVLGLANINLDSISIFKYYTPQTYGCNGYSLLQYGSDYFIAGIRLPSPGFTSDVVLLKIDSAGNRIWEKSYNQYVNDEAVSIIKLSNGNIMLGAGRSDLNQTHQHSNTWLIEVDTGGQVKRQWIDPNDSSYSAYGLLQTMDGGFIYGSQKYHSQSLDFYYTGGVVKVDSNFHKQWAFNDGSYNDVTGIYDIVELPDGSFVGCGNKPFYNGDLSVVSGWVVKLSSTGQVIWNNIYRGIDSTHTRNYLTDIDVMPDGSLIAVGYSRYIGHAPPDVGWFLKLDSNGCELESCLTTGISQSEIRNPKFAIFPNPASDQVFIESTTTTQGELTIADELGRVLYTNPHFDGATTIKVNNWMNGIYFYRLITTSNEQQSGKIVVQH